MSGFGYYVSPATRQREVTENERAIAQYDALLALPVDLDAAYAADCGHTVFVALLSRENAAAFGLTDPEVRDLADVTGANPAWARDIPETGRGWYARGESVRKRLESVYGDTTGTRREVKGWRSIAMRHLRTAKNALAR